MTLVSKDLIARIAEEADLSVEVVEKVYKAYWRYLRTQIEKIDFSEDKPHKYSFNIPSIGKLYTDENKVKLQKKVYNDIKKD